MRSTETLPENHTEILHIDLQKDKKLALLVNGLSLLLLVPVLLIGVLLRPVHSLPSSENSAAFLLRFGALLVGLVLYMVGHEWVHGIFMRRCCSAKVRFGFTGLYAFAGSDGYYCKKDYRMIALAPLVIWGLVFTLALIPLYFFSASWFWAVYILQAVNISGASGDLYVAWRLHSMPREVLIQDTGVSMTFFGPNKK